MSESKAFKKYKSQEVIKLRQFNEQAQEFIKLLDEYKIPKNKQERLIERFNNTYNPERNHLIKCDNFIMDMRKPSFFWFLVFAGFSVYGIISTTIKLINWIF